MILLKLLFVAQSFGFQSAMVRTAYIVDLTLGQALVETEQNGNSRFEVCPIADADPILIGAQLNDPALLCRAITQDIGFKSDFDYYSFRKLISAELTKRLSRGRWTSLIVDSYKFISSAVGTAVIITYVTSRAGLPLLWQLGTGAVGGVLYGVTTPPPVMRALKYIQLLKMIKSNGGQPVTLYTDDFDLFDLYQDIVQKVSKTAVSRFAGPSIAH